MPYAYSTFTLPRGAAAVRTDGTGIITREDAEGLVQRTTPGGQYYGLPLLIDNRQMDRVEPEARSALALTYNPNIEHPWAAVVVTDAVLRVTVSFLLRTTKASTVKLFTSEQEAIAWLDEQTLKDAARKTKTT